MYGVDTLFAYYSRRARQEQVAAINARTPAAQAAHRQLSGLLAARASRALGAE
ncbi:MAG: hypothetical protein ACRYFW_02505 [Janthinobacterium lividum]